MNNQTILKESTWDCKLERICKVHMWKKIKKRNLLKWWLAKQLILNVRIRGSWEASPLPSRWAPQEVQIWRRDHDCFYDSFSFYIFPTCKIYMKRLINYISRELLYNLFPLYFNKCPWHHNTHIRGK